jgi:hypothetical protein
MCEVGEYRRQTGEGQEKERDLFLKNHVAQDSFCDVKLASNLTKPGKLACQSSYNTRFLRLYGLIL